MQRTFQPGDVLMREGEPGDDCFIIESGQVEVLSTNLAGHDVVLATLGPGNSVGEMALVDNAPRSATVRAIDLVTAHVITRASLQADPDLASRVREQVEQLRIERFLRRASPFAHLPRQTLLDLIPRLQSSHAIAGSLVVAEHDPAHHFYLVRAGKLEVLVKGQRVRTLHEGDCFGEVALLGNGLRTATVRALEPSALLALDKTTFDQLVAQHASVRARLGELAHLRFRGAPAQPLLLPDPLSTLMPFLRRGQRDTLWLLLVLGVALFAVATLIASRIGGAALIVSLACGALLGPSLYVLYLRDRHLLPERGLLLLLPVVLASGVAVPLAIALEQTGLFFAPLSVAFVEEAAKLAAVAFLVRRRPSRFVMDGVVYGAAAGMSFAALETTIYGTQHLADLPTLISTLWLRALLSPFGHGTWTALVAAVVWSRRGALRVAAAFAVAVCLHALWDWSPLPAPWNLAWLSALGVIGLVLLRGIIQRALDEVAWAVAALNPELAASGPSQRSVAVTCADCRQPAPGGARYCPRCGQALRRAVTTP